MHLAAVRWVADALADPDTGVNAVVADGVPLDEVSLSLPMVRIADETRDDWVAYGTYGESQRQQGTVLIVRTLGDTESDVAPGQLQEPCAVGVHVVVPANGSGNPAATARLQAAVYLRAAKRVLASQYPQEVTRRNPVRFGCTITPPNDSAFRTIPMYDKQTFHGAVMIDALVISLSTDDPWSRGFAPDVATPEA